MAPGKMHPDEPDIDEPLVRGLLEAQFPEWAALPLAPVASAGTDNALYRLGDDLAVRLPRRPEATTQAAVDMRWLPVLAPHLPLAVPQPLALGEPAEGYPWGWAVYRWLPGRSALDVPLAHSVEAATALGTFVHALQRIDSTGGPPAGPANFYRGVPLATLDTSVRRAVAALLPGELDIPAFMAAWEVALAAPVWAGDPVWLHGDIAPGNLLVDGDKLSAVIDFGCMGIGDPACDLQPAWTVFDARAREAFRAAVDLDDATWARGKGWALRSVGALSYYRHTNPAILRTAHRTIEQVLADND